MDYDIIKESDKKSFRVWNKNSKSFETHFCINNNGALFKIIKNRLAHVNSSDYIVQRSTGLRTSYGQLIFEGDIFCIGDPTNLYHVIYRDTAFQGQQIRDKSFPNYIGLSYWLDDIDIVGNILTNFRTLDPNLPKEI